MAFHLDSKQRQAASPTQTRSTSQTLVLISLLALFLIFVLWFPVWIAWPHALVSRLLTALFGVSFAVVGLTFKWFAPLVAKPPKWVLVPDRCFSQWHSRALAVHWVH
jgi:hypothetical protein